MNAVALHILKSVAKHGEISLADALKLAKRKRNSHHDQYPLALLLEEDYLGQTINHVPPKGAEAMREFSLATTLHMFTLPKDQDGNVRYLGITSSGNIDPERERVFIKAKGALYLGDLQQKTKDRAWSFILGFLAGTLAAVASTWLKTQL